jgi:hypothetical protein
VAAAAAVYFTVANPAVFVVPPVTVSPAPAEVTAKPDNGLPYRSNAYTSTSSISPTPAPLLFTRTTSRLRWLSGTDGSGTHDPRHKLSAVNVTIVPDPTSSVDTGATAITVNSSAFVSDSVTVHVPSVPVVHDVADSLPDLFTPMCTS